MKKRTTTTGRKGAALALSAVLAMSPAAAIPAYAQEASQAAQTQDAQVPSTQDAATAEDTDATQQQAPATQAEAADAQTQAETGQGTATQDAEATTQADLDNAAEGSTVELKGTITTNLSVNKKLTLTAAEDAVMKAGLTINANDVTVSGVHFTLDGTTGATDSLRNSGKTGLAVKGCTFDITSNADAQLNSVWLGYGADSATVDGNFFYINLPGTDNSYVAINIVGATVKDTAVSNNQVYYRDNSQPVGSAHFLIANGNKSEAGQYGLSGLKVTGNKVDNITSLSADTSHTYGIGVSNAEDAVISDNEFSGLYMAVKPSMWPGEAPSKSIVLTSNMFTSCYVGIMMRTSDVEPGAVVSKDNEFGMLTKIPYAGLNGDYALVWQSEDGHLYPDVNNAASAGKTSLALVRDLNLGSAANVDDGQDVTIDLNGHKLNGSLTNFGNLTIKDSAGSDGAVSSIEIDGTGTTTIAGGTYDSSPYDKGFFGENSQVADGYGTLVRVREDDGSYKYTVLPKDDVLASATAKVETENGKLFFETTDEANAYAEKKGLTESDVKPAKYTVSFDTNGNGNVDSITVESGESVTLPAVPEVTGYRDGAWYDGDEKVEGEFTPTSDVTLVAKWYKIESANGTDNNGGSGSSNDINGDAGGNASNAQPTSKAMPQTGDDSLAGVAVIGVAGAVALGAGVVASKRRHDA